MVTWIDILIIIVIALYTLDGYRQGFLKIFFDICAVIISLLIALKFYDSTGILFVSWGLNANLAKPIGFFALWTFCQIIFYLFTILIFHYLPKYSQQSRLNRLSGIIPGAIKGTMIIAIFLIILMILPFPASFKNTLSRSPIATLLVRSTAKVESQMAKIFGQLNSSLIFFSIAPEDEESTKLNFQTNDFNIDGQGEEEMLVLINNERRKVGQLPLKSDVLLRNVARAHSMDMLRGGYFAHKDLAGQFPSDRLTSAGAIFQTAGENLALAPSIDLAHIGLMNSTAHRENILDSQYRKVGIGVIDAGAFGKMITQVFTD